MSFSHAATNATDVPSVRLGSSIGSGKAGWPDVALLSTVLALLLVGVAGYGLYEPHEAHFAGVAREMVLRGDWTTPHLNGAPYLNKPPLFYWMIALSYMLTGTISEWTARIPLALIGCLGCMVAWDWARRLWGVAAGRAAAAMLMVSVGWHLFGHQLLIDLLLAVIYLASLYVIWLITLEPTRRLYWVGFYVLLGLNIMAKGPIGLALTLISLLVFLGVRKKWDVLKHSRPLLGLLIVVAIVAPWLIMIESRHPGYLRYAIINENLKRVVDRRDPPDYTGVKVSVGIFLVATAGWLAPWSLLLPQIAAFAMRATAGRAGNGTPAQDEARVRALADGKTLLTIGALVPVLAFLPMPSRLIYYQLPAMPALVMLAAGWWCGAGTRRIWQAGAAWTFTVTGALIFSAGFWLPHQLDQIPDLVAAPMTMTYVDDIAFTTGVALLAGGVLLLVGRANAALAAMTAVLALSGLLAVKGLTAFDPVRSSKHLVEQLRDQVGPDCVWVSEGSKEIGASAGIAFYLGNDRAGEPRSVLVMEDDPERRPPAFPGAKPQYLINQAQLAELWSENKPVLFVTDFLRSDWERDRPRLPAGEKHIVPQTDGGKRRVYANSSAWSLIERRR
ncbi:MAG TPA: glycosyltransferase family 39 protein [Planctomycetota bacterium]|jgi:4-amino-4-deoxy-L-arabinose transferase-like glycosyltransferase